MFLVGDIHSEPTSLGTAVSLLTATSPGGIMPLTRGDCSPIKIPEETSSHFAYFSVSYSGKTSVGTACGSTMVGLATPAVASPIGWPRSPTNFSPPSSAASNRVAPVGSGATAGSNAKLSESAGSPNNPPTAFTLPPGGIPPDFITSFAGSKATAHSSFSIHIITGSCVVVHKFSVEPFRHVTFTPSAAVIVSVPAGVH